MALETRTFLHIGCGPKRKDQTTAGFNSANGFASVASRRRAAPYFDLWAVATPAPLDEGALRTLALAHIPG